MNYEILSKLENSLNLNQKSRLRWRMKTWINEVGMTEQNNFSLVLQQTPLSRSGLEIWKMLACDCFKDLESRSLRWA